MSALSPTVERWLPVVGFEGSYEVSDQGRVRNARTGLVLSPSRRGRYLKVNLWRDNRQYMRAVHQLVAAAFIGPRPGKLNVLHGDTNRENNQPGNLRYGTQAANMVDRAVQGGYPLKLPDVLAIRASPDSTSAAAAKFGCSKTHILRIRAKKAWAHA